MTLVRAETACSNGKEWRIYSLKTAFGSWISVSSQSTLFTGFILMLNQIVILFIGLCLIYQLNTFVFIRNMKRDTGALFLGDCWQHRSNTGARKMQLWCKQKDNCFSVEVKTIPTAVSISTNILENLCRQSNVLALSSIEPTLEISLARDLTFAAMKPDVPSSLYTYSTSAFFYTFFFFFIKCIYPCVLPMCSQWKS